MVAASVPRFGFEPEVCLARPILLHAIDSYERGDFIAAGVRLREAVRRFALSACHWYAVDLSHAMKRDKFARTGTLIHALRQAKLVDRCGFEILHECLDIGNAAAHLRPFCKDSLSGCLSLLFSLVDSEPFSAWKDRQPVSPATEPDDDCCCDDDDDDPADFWKGGAV